MSAEELPLDLQTSYNLAEELGEVNKLSAEQNARIKDELLSLQTPSPNVLRKLGEQAWKECWVDTPQKELLWQARDSAKDNQLVEIIAAYMPAGDAPEGYELLGQIDGFSVSKIEAFLRFGSYTDEQQTYIDSDFLEAARKQINVFSNNQKAANDLEAYKKVRALRIQGLSRIAYFSQAPEDYDAWLRELLTPTNDRLSSIDEMLIVANCGYEPALVTAKQQLLGQIERLNKPSSHYEIDGMAVAEFKKKLYSLIATAEVINRKIQNAAIPRIDSPNGPAKFPDGSEKDFLKIVSTNKVINILKQGVSTKMPYSPLELEVLQDWQEIASNSFLKTEDKLWDYARSRIFEIRKHMAEAKQQGFKSLKLKVLKADYSKLVNVPKREIPKTEFNTWAMFRDLDEYRRTGKESGHGAGQVQLRPEQRERIRRQYDEEDNERSDEVREAFTSINYALLYRALYCHIAGIEKVDIRI